ncbi:hypothetical protein FB567DRAFT_629835 [Paraphoma chrysanthemicola]|uniref:Uncharacterized protein n=1 Tax=Paraphoma chrysanthemicola TaxID=798071 RepID=A0A8K0R5I2_9PLEO|nr:hypothetical protein FB567DRAFT_629835 [Paraphoma chrysanthemicola]
MAPRAPSARLEARRNRIISPPPAITSPIAPSEFSAPSSPSPTPAATNTVGSKGPDSTGAGVDKNKNKKKKHTTTDIFGTDCLHSVFASTVFLAETLRSRDPVERILQDGMSTHLLAHIINQHRTGPKYSIHGNSLWKMLQFTMRDESKKKKEPGAKNWSFSLNKTDESKKVKKWPADKMTLAGLQVDCEKKVPKGNRPIDNVPFEALLVDVAHLPEGDDALDLTRCLTWIMHNPGPGLVWPRDF